MRVAGIARLAKFIETHFRKLDILINNAAEVGLIIHEEEFRAGGGFEQVTDERADLLTNVITEPYELGEKCLNINYYGTKAVTEALIPLLQLSKSPRIVNVSSSAGDLIFLHKEKMREELQDIEMLTEEKVDEIIQLFLKDFKNAKLQENGWPLTISAYKISKIAVNAYTRLLARRLASAAIFVKMGVLQIGISTMVIENKVKTLTITTFLFPAIGVLLISSPNHPTFDIEDAFSSNSSDYISASLDYFPALPGNISPDSSNDLTKYLLTTLAISPYHNDPYSIQAYDAIPPSQAITLHLETELQKAREQMGQNNKIVPAHVRISTLEMIIEDIQVHRRSDIKSLLDKIRELKNHKGGPPGY
nr:(+)-neomenthol dehydrogenase-like [Tanacetum cinerariifolium]